MDHEIEARRSQRGRDALVATNAATSIEAQTQTAAAHEAAVVVACILIVVVGGGHRAGAVKLGEVAQVMHQRPGRQTAVIVGIAIVIVVVVSRRLAARSKEDSKVVHGHCASWRGLPIGQPRQQKASTNEGKVPGEGDGCSGTQESGCVEEMRRAFRSLGEWRFSLSQI